MEMSITSCYIFKRTHNVALFQNATVRLSEYRTLNIESQTGFLNSHLYEFALEYVKCDPALYY